MNREKNYKVQVIWTGNTGTGTLDYRSYERSHELFVQNKPIIEGSSDTAFRGDKTKYNPEELLVGALSACHMLWFLHLCSDEGIIVTGYKDEAKGVMIEDDIIGGYFKEVHLFPNVTIKQHHSIEKANELHTKAHSLCFIANSVKFPVLHFPLCHAEPL